MNSKKRPSESLTLDIESTHAYARAGLDGAKCHRCGTYCTDLHENHQRTVRDLPISGKACYLRSIRRRFLCSHCDKSFSESLSFVQKRRDYTKRYEARIFHQVKENNIIAVQRLEGLTYDQIEGIFLTESRVRIPVNPFANLKRLGIDEISLRKGKQDFVLILTNLDTAEVVDVLEKRTQDKLCARLEQLAEQERSQIVAVAMDMWEPYSMGGLSWNEQVKDGMRKLLDYSTKPIALVTAFSPDCRYFALGFREGKISKVRLWNLRMAAEAATEFRLRPLRAVLEASVVSTFTSGDIPFKGGHEDFIVSVHFSPDGNTLVSNGSGKSLIV